LEELDVYVVLKLVVGLFNFPFEAESSNDGMEFKKRNGNTSGIHDRFLECTSTVTS